MIAVVWRLRLNSGHRVFHAYEGTESLCPRRWSSVGWGHIEADGRPADWRACAACRKKTAK